VVSRHDDDFAVGTKSHVEKFRQANPYHHARAGAEHVTFRHEREHVVEIGPDADEQQRSYDILIQRAFLVDRTNLSYVVCGKCWGDARGGWLRCRSFGDLNYSGPVDRCAVNRVSG